MIWKWIKRAALAVAILLLLVVGILLFLHTAAGKSFVRKKAENFLRKKWGTEVSIGKIDYRLPNWIALEHVLILDRRRDTLLSGGRLYVGISLLKLLSNTLEVKGISLESIVLHCNRRPGDSAFNYQFILDAFASPGKEPVDTSPGTPLRLSVNQLHLDHVNLSFRDYKAQFYLSAAIDSLSLFPDELNLEKTNFHVRQFLLQNSQVTIVDSSSSKSQPPQADTRSRGDPSPLIIALQKLALQNIHFSYQKPSDKTGYDIRVGNLRLTHTALDLGRSVCTTQDLQIDKAAVKLLAWNPPNPSHTEEQQESTNDQWTIRAGAIALRDNSFVFQNAAVPVTKGLDFQHITAQNINLESKQNTFDSSGLYTELNALSLRMNDQVNLKEMSAVVRLTNNLLNVKDLTIALNQSLLSTRGDIVWELKPGGHRSRSPQFRITRSYINYGDLLLVQPGLRNAVPVSLAPSENIQLSGNFSGTLQELSAKDMSLFTSGKQFQLRGDINVSLGKKGVGYTANFHQLQVKKQLLSKDLLRQLEKAGISLPQEVALTGRVQAGAEKITTDLKLNSAYGQLYIRGTVQNINHPNRLHYDFNLEANQLETGKWIGLDSLLGKITGQVFIKGTGTNPHQSNIVTQLKLQSAVINGYAFSNIDLEATLNSSQFTTQVRILDPNLETEMNLRGYLNSPGPAVQGDLLIKRADLNQLKLTSDTILVASTINVDATYGPSQKINANVRMDSTIITLHGKEIFTDSLSFLCKADADSMLLLAHSPFIKATVRTNYPVNALSSEIASVVQTLSQSSQPVQHNPVVTLTQGHRTSLDITLSQTELLHSFIPGLDLKQAIRINGHYDAEKKDSQLFLQVMAPGIRYNQVESRDLQIKAESVDSAIHFDLSCQEVAVGNNLLTHASLNGRLHKDVMLINARIDDSSGKEYYAAKLEVKTGKTETTIRILDDLTLNHNIWKVPNDNWIRVLQQGFIVNHFALENKGQILNVNSKDPQTLSPIDIRVDSFDIANIMHFLSHNDTLLAQGILTADISLQQPISKIPIVTGNILATGLSIYNIPLGEFTFQSRTHGDSLDLQGALSGPSRVNFDGSIHLTNRKVDIQTHLQKLDMKLVQELAKGVFTHLSGQVTADIQLEGSPDTPHIRGSVAMDSIAFALQGLNTLYRINKQKLLIEYPELNLGQFTLSDTAGHQLTIKGKLNLADSGALDLAVETKDFVALNATRKPGSSLFGKAILDAQIGIKGSRDEPIIEGSAFLKEKSSVHFMLLPASNASKNRKEGIVFVNIDTLDAPVEPIAKPLNDTVAVRKKVKGLKYNLNLGVSKDAEFSVVIDPSTNDELVAKGEAKLNAGLDVNGNLGLTGVYQLQSGYYRMNNLLLRGKFMMVKGSSIQFDGDPMSAVADVTTEYEIQTTPKGLLEYKETDDPDYSQRLPFLVVFMIKGPVSKPALSFDIKLKEGKAGLKSSVKADIEHALDRLRNDITALNKQVFSLLLTKRFAGTGGGTDLASSNLNANNALQEGVSSFLTEAMNQAADQLIKGVDIDVNMKSYKSGDDPVSKTDLGVAMSKDLLNNRLIIRVEENFAIGGDATTAAAKSGTQYVPDITSTYKLSKDGRFQVKAYQKNEYDAVVQGYFTEVGVSFTIELAYDKFREMLKRRKKTTDEEK